MRAATWAYLTYLQRQHELARHELDPWALAHELGIRVIGGSRNWGTAGPPAVIALARDVNGPRQRFTLHHEIGHVLMQRAELEEAVMAEVDPEDADDHLEAVVNFGAGLLLMPAPLLALVAARHGDTPAAIVALAREAQATLPAALRRWVHGDPDAHRGAFVTSGSYIADAAACNLRLPFWTLDRVPEAHAQPGVVAQALGRAKVLGVMTW